MTKPQVATRHGYTPSTGPFASESLGCQVMLARYQCPYPRSEHDPDLPPEKVDTFGYVRSKR